MARTTAKKATKTARRPGRPSNASLEANRQSYQNRLVQMVGAAASAAAEGAVRAAMSGQFDGGVSTIGVPASDGNATQTTPRSATSARRGRSPAAGTTGPKRPPGRLPDPESALSKSAVIYAANVGKKERKDIVNLLVEKLGIKKSVANTYYHSIHKKAQNGGVSTRKSATRKAA